MKIYAKMFHKMWCYYQFAGQKCCHYLTVWCFADTKVPEKNLLLQGIDRPTLKKSHLYISNPFFLTFNLDRRPKILSVQGHQSQESRVAKNQIKAKHFKETRWTLSWGTSSKRKMLFAVYFHAVNRWQSIWGNVAGKRYREHWLLLGYSNVRRVPQSPLVTLKLGIMF